MTAIEWSGNRASVMLQQQHDASLRAHGSQLAEALSRLEADWQKDGGAVASH